MRVTTDQFTPNAQDDDETVVRNAVETIHQRISETLKEQGQVGLSYIRSHCTIATIFADSLSEEGARIEVSCPEDEIRRAKVPDLLRVGSGNRMVLYPMNEATYENFRGRMKQVGKDIGQYEVFTRQPDGTWHYEECFH